jgi:glycosyltransferase involved in cell wall biosynthesis
MDGRGDWKSYGRNQVEALPNEMKVAFVYAGGRHLRGSDGPSDFFYGSRELPSLTGWFVDCLEVDAEPADPLTGLIAGKLLGSFVPPRTSSDWIARTRRLIPKLKEHDVVVATATEISFGLALWKSLGILKKPLVGLTLGAASFPIGSELRRIISASLFARMHGVLFADSEKEELLKRFDLENEQLEVAWFGVDEKFWIPPQARKLRSGILSVGNDGRRDYSTLINAARLMPTRKITVITRFDPPQTLPSNVRWQCIKNLENYLPLKDLLPLYQSSECVVLPLRESIQPSGQSVAMQAMMCGAPVVISKTQGWWGSDVIREEKEVTLITPGKADELAAAIQETISPVSVLNGRSALLEARWTAQGFAERLAAVIERASSSE